MTALREAVDAAIHAAVLKCDTPDGTCFDVCRSMPCSCVSQIRDAAIAAILLAIREPTEEMLIAQHFECDPMADYPGIRLIEPLTIPRAEIIKRWQIMLGKLAAAERGGG